MGSIAPLDVLRKRFLLISLVVLGAVRIKTCSVLAEEDGVGMRAQGFVDSHVAKMRPLEKAAAIAWWDANI